MRGQANLLDDLHALEDLERVRLLFDDLEEKRDVADLHQGVDEEAQAELGRQPAGRSMRRIDQPKLLEVRHHVADRGRRERHRDDA